MKKKVFISILAGVLALSTLAACGEKGGKQVGFGAYWHTDSQSRDDIDEQLTYEVEFKKGGGLDELDYTLSYGKGSYTTRLTSTVEGYTYTTEFSIPVTFVYENEEPKTFTDSVKTTVRFKAENPLLEPIYSFKEMISHTPASSTANPSSVEDCYAEYHYTIETNYENGEGVSKVVNLLETEDNEFISEFTYGGGNYSYVDNELLLLAMRAVPEYVESGKVKTYAPTEEDTYSIKFAFEDATADEFTLSIDGNPETKKSIEYREGTLSLSATNPGPSQTIWIATCPEPLNNPNHNVMLRLETDMAYSLGSLVYTLKTIG